MRRQTDQAHHDVADRGRWISSPSAGNPIAGLMAMRVGIDRVQLPPVFSGSGLTGVIQFSRSNAPAPRSNCAA